MFEGEFNNESAWNVTILSPMFSFLLETLKVKDILSNFLVRSLSYPLIRNWSFSFKVISDVIQILEMGKTAVLKALLAVKIILDKDECRYIFSKIYLNDYCGWIQSESFQFSKMEKIAAEFKQVANGLEKSLFRLIDLVQIETLLEEE